MKNDSEDRYGHQPEPLSVDELITMLAKAGAPEPHEEARSILSAYCWMLRPNHSFTSERMLPPVPVPIQVREAQQKAQAGVVALHKHLPTIISYLESVSQTEAPPVQALLDALVDVMPKRAQEPYVWHTAADQFFDIYCDITADDGLSGDGPSARFIQLALERLGYGTREYSAIEKAVRRRRKV